jgi:hypothetical protein
MSITTESVHVVISNESHFYEKVLVVQDLYTISLYKLYYLVWMYGACINDKKDTLYIFPCEHNGYFKRCGCKSIKRCDVWMGPYITNNLYPKCCNEISSTYSSMSYDVLKYCVNYILSTEPKNTPTYRVFSKLVNNLEALQFDSIDAKNIFRWNTGDRMYLYLQNKGGLFNEIDEAFKHFTGLVETSPGFGNHCSVYLKQPSYIFSNIAEVTPYMMIEVDHETIIKKQKSKIIRLKEKILKLKSKCVAKDEKIAALKSR